MVAHRANGRMSPLDEAARLQAKVREQDDQIRALTAQLQSMKVCRRLYTKYINQSLGLSTLHRLAKRFLEHQYCLHCRRRVWECLLP